MSLPRFTCNTRGKYKDHNLIFLIFSTVAFQMIFKQFKSLREYPFFSTKIEKSDTPSFQYLKCFVNALIDFVMVSCRSKQQQSSSRSSSQAPPAIPDSQSHYNRFCQIKKKVWYSAVRTRSVILGKSPRVPRRNSRLICVL